jgi:hypothetical protein
VQRAAERGVTTLALTDRDTVAGTVRFATAAAAAGIRPVFGVDVAVASLSSPDPAAGRPRTPVRGGAHVVEPPLRITLLAQNAAGWARLCRLVSAAHAVADGTSPVVSWATLRAFADNDLVVLLGPSSEPVRALSAGRPDVAEQLLAPWRELAGERLRLEAVYRADLAPVLLVTVAGRVVIQLGGSGWVRGEGLCPRGSAREGRCSQLLTASAICCAAWAGVRCVVSTTWASACSHVRAASA